MKVLDTDILTHYLKGHAEVGARVRQATQEGEEIVITVITRIEVLQGRFDSLEKAADGTALQEGWAWLCVADRDLAQQTILGIDTRAAAEFDRLRPNKKLTRKIGRRDLLIAAITLGRGATLVTRNLKHFRQVPGLRVENWMD